MGRGRRVEATTGQHRPKKTPFLRHGSARGRKGVEGRVNPLCGVRYY